jgi:hypothetical protein
LGPAEAPVRPDGPVAPAADRSTIVQAGLALPAPEEVAAAVRRSLGDLGCGRLAVGADAGLQVSVAGLYPEGLDRERIVRLIEGSGARSQSVDLKPISGELCAAVRLAEAAATPGIQPTVAFNHLDGVFHAGDWAAFEIGVPREVEEAYLYVAFVDPKGEVVHLYPTPEIDLPLVTGGQHLRLGTDKEGEAGDGHRYEVVPPFGTGLVLAIVSPVLMPGLVVKDVRPLPAYLDALRRNLDQAQGRGPIFVAVRTLDMLPR